MVSKAMPPNCRVKGLGFSVLGFETNSSEPAPAANHGKDLKLPGSKDLKSSL